MNANGAGKRALPSTRLVLKKLRITRGQASRLLECRAMHDGKTEADALRDILNAGLRVVLPQLAATSGGGGQKIG